MTVRPFRAQDVPGLAALLDAIEVFTAEERRVALEIIDLAAAQPDQRDYVIGVVEDGAGGLAGYACYGPTPLTDGTCDLYWMAVAPGCRRRKYGQDLIGWVEDGVRQSGGRLIVVETSSQEKYAGTRSFYARMGYEAAARIRDYYRAGDDLVIFRKSLIGEGA